MKGNVKSKLLLTWPPINLLAASPGSPGVWSFGSAWHLPLRETSLPVVKRSTKLAAA